MYLSCRGWNIWKKEKHDTKKQQLFELKKLRGWVANCLQAYYKLTTEPSKIPGPGWLRTFRHPLSLWTDFVGKHSAPSISWRLLEDEEWRWWMSEEQRIPTVDKPTRQWKQSCRAAAIWPHRSTGGQPHWAGTSWDVDLIDDQGQDGHFSACQETEQQQLIHLFSGKNI